MEVDEEYHPKIIGRRGANVTKLRDDFGVNIQFPRRDDENQRIITITGYENDAEAAKEEILKIVRGYVSGTKFADFPLKLNCVVSLKYM